MKKKPGKLIRSILSIIMILCLCQSALADTLKLPPGLKTIEDEAFHKDISLDKVVLPEGIEKIGQQAFADSGLMEINLPESLSDVAENAFEGTNIEEQDDSFFIGIEEYDTVFTDSMVFRWKPIQGATEYRIFLGSDSGGVAASPETDLKSRYIDENITMADTKFYTTSGRITGTISEKSRLFTEYDWIYKQLFKEHERIDLMVMVVGYGRDKKAIGDVFDPKHRIYVVLSYPQEDPAPVFIGEHAKAYEAWWNNNVASLYKIYTQQAYSKDNVYSDHNFLLRKMAELADLKRDEDTANANQWKEKYNSEDNFWLLDDEARLRLTLTNLAKTIEEDKAKENLIVHKDLQNVSLVSLANQEVALTDNKMARVKDASDWAINAIRTAVNVYSVYENMETETATELSDKQKLANVFIDAFKEAILRFPTAVMETLIEAQAQYDAAYILRAYTREYVNALKESCEAYADYIADTYFGSNKLFEKDNNDYYGKAVKIFLSAFNKAGSDDAVLIKKARNAILSGTGYSYEEVLKYASEYTDDLLSRLDKQFWCQQFVNLLRDIARNILEEIFDKWDEQQIIGMLDQFIVIKVKEDCSIDCSFDFDGLVEQMLDYQKVNSTAVMLTGIQLTDSDFNSGWAKVKEEIIGKNADGYVTNDISKALKDNVKITGKIKKIAETAWKVGEDIVKMSHDLIELDQIGQGKTLYDTYGCALIDSFGQRINMRAKGEIVTGMTEEHFAAWDVKKKESQRQALVSLLNLDEYIVITYKNMKTINENNGNKFNSGYEWADDSDIDYALKTIRNIRTAIKDVPKECQIYEK